MTREEEIKKVLEMLLQKSSGINTEWSSTQDRIDRAIEQILAITKPEIDEEKLAKLLFNMQNTRALNFHQLSSYYSDRWRKRAHEIATSLIIKEEK